MIARLRTALRWLLYRKRAETDLDAELRDYFEREVEHGLRSGLSPQEAHFAAQRLFGSPAMFKEQCRDTSGTRWLDDFVQDCRYGIRVLLRSPAFTAVAVISLALGIGAGAAIFTLLDRVMLRTLPVPEPERLVQITRFHPPYGPSSVSYPLFQQFSKDLTSFQELLAQHTLGVRDITVAGNPEPVQFVLVSGSYFRVLGIRAAAGSLFGPEVDRTPGGSAVAVISYRYWKRRFASDPHVIGTTFRRLNTLFTIVGVTPRESSGTIAGQDPDITVPLTMDAQVRGGPSWLREPNYSWLSIMGRLQPGRTRSQAEAEAKKVFGNIAAHDASGAQSDRERRARLSEYVELQPAGNGFDNLRRRFAQPLLILMTAVSLMLLLACANLANLLLARSAQREREIAVRLAIGAGRGRLVRQLLAEGLLIGAAGGIFGVALAYILDQALLNMMSNGGPRLLLDLRPDAHVLLFALASSLAACLLFSLAPVLQTLRQPVQPELAGRNNRWRLGHTLVIVQMAISIVLLIAAGLFGRTLQKMYTLDAGFDRRGVILFSTNGARLGYDRARFERLQNRIPKELEEHSPIESATVAMFPPISGGGWDGSFVVEGTRGQASEDIAHVNSVGIDFFKTFHTPVLLGREFNDRDTAASPRVAIVNESFARAHFSSQSPIGKWLAFSGPERQTHYEIVGLVKDVKYESLRQVSPPTVYMMNGQVPPGPDSYIFAVRTPADTATAFGTIEATLARFDPALRPVDMISLDDHIAHSLLRERLLATVAGFFGTQALILCAIGIYGLMIFQVARRQREIGIRIALGAGRTTLIGMVLRRAILLALAGAAIGALAGIGLIRIAENLLYGIAPDDPATIAGSIALLLLIALASAFLPALAAARTNPVDSLRA